MVNLRSLVYAELSCAAGGNVTYIWGGGLSIWLVSIVGHGGWFLDGGGAVF